jgi:DNA-binding winged helix-turn-helix (wHTH) protein/TolB-like protein/Tfp pilus assembly protein PilF
MIETGGPATAEPRRFLDFGPFRLDRRERLLYRDGTVSSLPPKAIDLLLALMEEPGRLRTKDELIGRVWPDVIVDESNLTQNIFLLRKALADDGNTWIATIPRRGYRFIGVVTEAEDASPVAEVELPSPPSPAFSKPVRRRAIPLAVAVLAVSTIVVIGAAAWLLRHRTPDFARTGNNSIHSIAVLPFQPLDSKQNDRILELGMADSLINKLSQLSEVAVSPMQAVAPYLDGHSDSLAAGRELGVDGVVEGTIQRAGGRVRCTVRLLRVANGSAVWADHYDEDAADVFSLEDHVAERVATALDIHLGPEQRVGLSKRYTNDRQAYDLYLQGLLAWQTFNAEGLESSIRYFNAALARDPHYALAYAGLAKSYSVMYIYGPMAPAEAAIRSKDAAIRALSIDPQIAQAHISLAACAIFQEWNWNVAEEEVQRALQLDPSSDAHTLRGYVLQARGKPQEAVAELRRQLELTPQWRIAQNDCVLGLYYARRYDEAIAEGLQLLTVRPRSSLLRYVVGRSMLMKGRAVDAAAQQVANVSQAPDYPYSIAEVAVVNERQGDHAGFLKQIARLEILRPKGEARSVDYALATVYAQLNNADAAFKALDASYSTHFPFLWHIRIDAAFDPIRQDPRYTQLLARINLGAPTPSTSPLTELSGPRVERLGAR